MRKRLLLLLGLLVCLIASIGCGDDNAKTDKPTENIHIYDNAKVIDLKNGPGTKVVGKASVLEINSNDLTQAALEDWYFNYVSKNIGDEGEKWYWAVIVYKDKKDMGTFCNSMLVSKDVAIKKNDKDDGWSMAGNSKEILVEDSENPGHLKVFDPNAKPKQEDVQPTGEAFTVEIGHTITKVGDHKYQIDGTTNLPDNAELIIGLRSPEYSGSSKQIVSDGQFSTVLSGENLNPGDYDLSISMSVAKFQKGAGVVERIGAKGENMQGEYVTTGITASLGKSVSYQKVVHID